MHLKFIPGEKEMELNTPLWRYMKLSTFLLLLKGTAFIPLLSKLQEADPKEVRASKHSAGEDAVCKSDVFREAADWLEKKHTSRRFDLSKLSHDGCFDPGPHLLDEWRFQLSTRRCPWCWCAPPVPALAPAGGTGRPHEPGDFLESMAMWNLYARDGVAVKTTLGQITDAVVEPGLEEMLVAPICYDQSVLDWEHAKRPFVFKTRSYRHEEEVRLVFRTNAAVADAGVKLRLDPGRLLNGQEVVISPYVEADEAAAIKQVAREVTQQGDREMLPALQVTFRRSSERTEGDSDDQSEIEWADELRRHVGLFTAEEDLPALLQDL